MNENSLNPYDPPTEKLAQDKPVKQLPFKDQSFWLCVFGAVLLLMGGFCFLMIPFMLMMSFNPTFGPETDLKTMVPALGVYAMMGITAVALGYGSFQSRRWARDLVVILAWMFLIGGVVSIILLAITMPSMKEFQDETLPGGVFLVMAIALGITGCLFIVVPGIFIAFYQSKNVVATCEHWNPKPSWTDRCPQPVLALSLTMAMGAVTILPSLFTGSVIPFFGMLLSGIPGAVVLLGSAVLFGYLAWGTYKLQISALWITLLVCIVMGISTMITFSQISMKDYYEATGMPEAQIEQIMETGMLDVLNMPLLVGLSLVVMIAYVVWVRKYFQAKPGKQASG